MHHAKITDNLTYPEHENTHKLFFGIAILGAIASILGYFINPEQFYFSYLTSFTFYASIALGCLFFVMVHHITRSEYGVVLRRIPETYASFIYIFAILFIPILIGVETLYLWTDEELLATDKLIAGKSPYLNIPFFIARNVLYFTVWSYMGYKLYKNSVAMDKSGDWGLDTAQRKIAGPGLFIFGFTLAFASFDWMMSLDPPWFSTMFGVYYFAMTFQVFFAVVILTVLFLHKKGLLTNTIRIPHISDLSRMLFGFTVFYAYIAFSQFFLIYYANIPEETLWFYHRLEGNWENFTYLLLIGRFVVPFLILLPAASKNNMKLVGIVSAWIVIVHFIELHWIVMPTLHHYGMEFSWIDIATLLGIGGLFMGMFFRQFRKENMVSNNDPRLEASLNKH
ncbi:MAG TPA: hypothetical protein DCE78_04885 [Bacteroidetes bacterium]|nr:hypothetical protein [Bacteroidota bacterium]